MTELTSAGQQTYRDNMRQKSLTDIHCADRTIINCTQTSACDRTDQCRTADTQRQHETEEFDRHSLCRQNYTKLYSVHKRQRVTELTSAGRQTHRDNMRQKSLTDIHCADRTILNWTQTSACDRTDQCRTADTQRQHETEEFDRHSLCR